MKQPNATSGCESPVVRRAIGLDFPKGVTPGTARSVRAMVFDLETVCGKKGVALETALHKKPLRDSETNEVCKADELFPPRVRPQFAGSHHCCAGAGHDAGVALRGLFL